MSDEIVLKVTNLSKSFHIYDKPHDRLKQTMSLGAKKYYREFWALNDVNFELKRGEALGIIGRNGSGKSTLLQLICQTLTPTTGTIERKGRIAALLELGAGFNPQFTGRENVYINGAILGFSRKEIDERFEEIAAFADIGEFIDQPVKSYSSGMFVRLAFAVQACVSPDILIIDEALAVGDVFFRQKCYKFLNSLLKKGVSIILVTHAMNEVEQFCDRTLFLKKGKTVFLGPANEGVKRYYISDQTLAAVKQNHNSKESMQPQMSAPSVQDTKDFFWPRLTEFTDISTVSQVSNGLASCLSLAICDTSGDICHAFQQGETASFFYEFMLLEDIEIPAAGLVIQNQNGINVHGKSTVEYGTPVPQSVKKGEVLRIRQDICLEIAIGDYTFEIGLASMPQNDYEKRAFYHYEEFYASQTRLCHLPNVGQFSVLPRSHTDTVQLLHHGIANLPGHCQVFKVPVESKNL